MTKHVVTLSVDSEVCFEMARVTRSLADVGFHLSGPLIVGELPSIVDAVALAVYGIVVLDVRPSDSSQQTSLNGEVG